MNSRGGRNSRNLVSLASGWPVLSSTSQRQLRGQRASRARDGDTISARDFLFANRPKGMTVTYLPVSGARHRDVTRNCYSIQLPVIYACARISVSRDRASLTTCPLVRVYLLFLKVRTDKGRERNFSHIGNRTPRALTWM